MSYIMIFLGINGCSSDNNTDDNPNNNGSGLFIDSDGDGVSDETELNDGTNLNEACSYLVTSQQFNKTSEGWRNQDCDGDGVTNAKEVDPDNNNINEGNGTDPLDECSLNIDHQTLIPSSTWLLLDCDADCIDNQTEVNDGTDPTDPDDFLGAGNQIQTIISGHLRFLFDQNGSRFIGSQELSGDPVLTFHYNANNQLFQIESHNPDLPYILLFEYAGDQLTSYGYTTGDGGITSVTYDGNFIITAATSPPPPPGLFTQKFEIDPVSGKAIGREAYYFRGAGTNDYIYWTTTYSYDTNKENLLEIRSVPMGYDPDTATYYEVPEISDQIELFEYSEEALNPAYEAYRSIYIHGLLDNFNLHTYLYPDASDAVFSKRFLYNSSYEANYYTSTVSWVIDCIQSNNYPTEATSTFNASTVWAASFIYE